MNAVALAAGAVQRGALQKQAELASFLAALDPWPAVVVEIGCDAGGTLWAWSQVARRVIGVDLPRGPYSTGRALDPHGAEMVLGDSHDPGTYARLVAALGDDEVDLLFIDGDHTYDGCRADFDMYSPLVRPGGVIAMHDVVEHHASLDVGVPRVWAEVRGRDGEAIVVGDPSWGGIGWLRTAGVAA